MGVVRLCVFAMLGACGGEMDVAVDASVDAVADADTRCAAGLMCLERVSIDSSSPAPGRLVVAWQPATGTTWCIAHDVAWAAEAITQLPLADITAPPMACQFQGPCGSNVPFGSATVIVSTDPDGSGNVTSDEINSGYASGDTYGIHQEIVTWSSTGCGPTGSLEGGLEPGVHIYRREPPITIQDGRVTALQVCAPRSSACQGLENPF